MAKFKVGDRVWFKAPVTGEKITAKITATLGGEKYGFEDDDGIKGTIEGGAIYPLNACRNAVSCAANATGEQVIASQGKYKLVYNPIVEGYWFYNGSNGEGMTDVNGRVIFGKDRKSDALAEFRRLVATAKNSRACNSTNPIVRKAMNAVANAITGTGRVNYDDDIIAVYNPNGQQVYKGSVDDCPYKKDDWKYDASTRTYRVDGPNGDYRTIAKVSNAAVRNDFPRHDFKVGQYVGMVGVNPSADVKMRIVKIQGNKVWTEGDAEPWDGEDLHHWDDKYHSKWVYNATPGNWSGTLKAGTKVEIVDTPLRYGGEEAEILKLDGTRYVARITSRADKPVVYLQPNQISVKNSEDAQGHEHGSDGKFTSKGGGSDGGDSYEDPKTKRMKERLAKMREKNEVLRKEIDQRKAALAGKKEETEKMRADVMKANVEKWKAGLPKSKNAIVAKALNAELTTIDELLRKNGLSRSEFDAMRKEMERKGSRAAHFIRGKDGRLVFKADGLARNEAARNDKWIDDFHVIVTGGTPDRALVDALKKKAAAWKVAKRNFSDAAASAAHDKATDDAMAIAKRLGARWIQQGAVLKVVMPNACARNADEYVVRKAFTPGKWFLERKTASLGDRGETKVFGSEAEAMDYARKNGLKVARAKNAITSDEATAKRDVEQSLRKIADVSARFAKAKATARATHSDPMWAGWVDLTFLTDEDADAFNPYYLFNKLHDDKGVLPKWSWGIGGFTYDRNGKTWSIHVGRFQT